ncbi:MAG: sodium:solute symporter family protein [Opitutales bacterium]|nr:sodium:solute symporter family protein [Opitutales bacterium]
MMGLHIIDLAVIGVYFAIVVYIGFRVMKKVNTQEDFFLGGRQFNRFYQTFSQFGQATSSESAVQSVAEVGANGVPGALRQSIQAGMGYPINWLFPKWLRRSRLMSMAGYFNERFESKNLATLYSVAQISLFLMIGGMGLYATSTTIMAITEKPLEELTVEERMEYEQAERLSYLSRQPVELMTPDEIEELEMLRELNPSRLHSYLNQNLLILFIAFIVILYAASGGLEAAVYTDTMQGVFILALTVMLVPFGMIQLNALHGTTGLLGPFEALHRTLPQTMFEIFGSPTWAEFTWYNILALAFISMAGNIAFSNNLVVAGAARTDKVASWGGLSGQLTKGVGQVFWIFLALIIIGLFGEQTTNPDLLWGQAARALLPIGLLGLMVACLTAAYMSSADMHMMTVSGLLTHHIYKPVVQNKSEYHYVQVGRLMTLVYIVGAVLIAMNSDNIFRMFKFMLLINLCCGPAMLMGFLWRRTNTAAVWASMGSALALTLLIPLMVMLWPGSRYNESLLLASHSPHVEKQSIASERDVNERFERIENWKRLEAKGLATTVRPEPLQYGEPFIQTFLPAANPIFWDGNFDRNDSGQRYARGFFKAELYLLHLLGVDFTSLTPSRVEFISLMFRLFFPFAAVLLIGMLTPPINERHLNSFYAKQRTPVHPDPIEDRKAVEKVINDPKEINKGKIWPNSNWEIDRINSYDAKGISVGASVGVILVLLIVWLTTIGRSAAGM